MTGFLFDENLPRVPALQTHLPITHALEIGPRPTVLRFGLTRPGMTWP